MKSRLKISIGDGELLVCTVSRLRHLKREKHRVTECQIRLHTELNRVRCVNGGYLSIELKRINISTLCKLCDCFSAVVVVCHLTGGITLNQSRSLPQVQYGYPQATS